MEQNKLYKISATTADFSFSESVKGCIEPCRMSINENGEISLIVECDQMSALACEMGARMAQESPDYEKVRRKLIKKLYKAYTEDNRFQNFYRTAPILESASTLSVETLYSKAVEARTKLIDRLQAEAENVPLPKYERKHLDVSVTQQDAVKKLLRKEAIAKLSWGVFKPSESKISAYIREHTQPILLELNRQSEEVYTLAERVETSKEARMNVAYAEEHDAKVDAIQQKIREAESNPVSIEQFYAEDALHLEASLNGLLSSEIEWPLPFSIKYQYDQSDKAIKCSVFFSADVENGCLRKYAILKNKEVSVFCKKEDEFIADYDRAICGVVLYLATAVLNVHQYVKSVSFEVSRCETTSRSYIFYREALAGVDFANTALDECYKNVVGDKPISCSQTTAVEAADNAPIGSSANAVAEGNSTALDRYLVWLQKQNDVLAMRGVKEVNSREVQVTDAFIQKRYSEVMSAALYRQAFDGVAQIIGKEELFKMEYERNLLTYRAKLKVDCESLLKKASAYEFDGKMHLAIKYYEQCLEYGCETPLPYDRLIAIYTEANNPSELHRVQKRKQFYLKLDDNGNL